MSETATDLYSDLLGCLELQELPSADEGTAVFQGRNQQLTYHRLFGGQLLAQFVRTAALACPGKAVKSLHVLFPREGSAAEPVRYEVARHQEGRTFATVGITARQDAGVIATASVSLHAVEDGPAGQSVAPVPALPGPESRIDLHLMPWETRSTFDLDTPKSETAEYEFWIRTPEVDAELAPALASYATDLTIIGTALRAVDGISQQDAGKAFTSAVTSHNLWFHRPFRSDEWLLIRQHSPLYAGGRCFGRGDILTEDGTLVASFAQEALLRFRG
ncbi:MAG TPA: acyl-CoA thioesterase domain-containing protein [Yinghuangia sp.]|uniref:acyl-CoA thioesterase n=1 Tax=Yinghuangia sp. YIM S10712 TaxID=3436930 RepID=UPI002BDAC3EC|nr:acyl-CoA thioesterase domain-containing protein [Yinghuangia sp.]